MVKAHVQVQSNTSKGEVKKLSYQARGPFQIKKILEMVIPILFNVITVLLPQPETIKDLSYTSYSHAYLLTTL